MNTESPRVRAMLAGGAALLVFGITIPATATTGEAPGRPADGTAGVANEKAQPKKHTLTDEYGDTDNGFRCDNNGGAGIGNPALGSCDGDGVTEPGAHPGKGGNTTGGGPGSGPTYEGDYSNGDT